MQSDITQQVHIELGERSYNIFIGANLLDCADIYSDLPDAACAMVVSNQTVAPLYAQQLISCLMHRYATVHLIELPDGESYKNWDTVNLIFNALLNNGCDRRTVLFALGGGVVGDITGFAAASYMRGVPFVQVPTTLLAQVDSSVGGKTGINHPLGKNMIGAFYQPQRVICDLNTLKTLPQREINAGLAEIIKYGPIADVAFFEWMEAHVDALQAGSAWALAYAVKRSCEIKAGVVGQDERESGLRAILNFGHTFGHAIEAGVGYGHWLHGEAVGCGMVMAARLSEALGLLDKSFVQRLKCLVERAGLPTVAPLLDADPNTNVQKYFKFMRLDKKSQAGEIQFVLIDGTGRAIIRKAPDEVVAAVIHASCTVQ